MRTSLQDLIATCPNQLEANSIIVFDGCHWIVEQIPDGITCEDISRCVSCDFLFNTMHFTNGIIANALDCTVQIDPVYINNLLTVTLDCTNGDLVIGTTHVDLSCMNQLYYFFFKDGTNMFSHVSGNQILFEGLDGLRAVVTPTAVQFGLPTGALDNQVLTWDTVHNKAHRANALTIYCDQIQTCMAPIISAIQHEINILAGQLCPCGNGGTTSLVDIYEEGLLVQANVQQLNFIGDCVTATRNTDTNQADITITPTLTRSGCGEIGDTTPYILSLCGTDIDLSCLANGGPGGGLSIYNQQGGAPVPIFLSTTQNLNFQDCLVASEHPGDPTIIDINFLGVLEFTGCGNTNPADDGKLSFCNTTVDLNCLRDHYVAFTVFVNKSGSDVTGTVENFALQFETIQAAINAAETGVGHTGMPYTVIVYPGVYYGGLVLKNKVNVHFEEGAVLVGQISVEQSNVTSKITGNGVVKTVAEGARIFAINPSVTGSIIDVELDHVEFTSTSTLELMVVDMYEASSSLNQVSFKSKSTTVAFGTIGAYDGDVQEITFASVSSSNSLDISLGAVSIDHPMFGSPRFAGQGGFSLIHAKDNTHIYFHHTYFQLSPRLNTMMEDAPENLTFVARNGVGGNGKTYFDNIYIKLPMGPDSTNTSFIKCVVDGAQIAFNDVLRDFLASENNNPQESSSIAYVGGALNTGLFASFYGQNQIMAVNYVQSLTSGTTGVYNVTGLTYSNRPSTNPAVFYYHEIVNFNTGATTPTFIYFDGAHGNPTPALIFPTANFHF